MVAPLGLLVTHDRDLAAAIGRLGSSEHLDLLNHDVKPAKGSIAGMKRGDLGGVGVLGDLHFAPRIALAAISPFLASRLNVSTFHVRRANASALSAIMSP
jgi:hypothetical protein